MRKHTLPALSISLVSLLSAQTSIAQTAEPDWDKLIINARIVDGTGSPWYRGSVAIDEGRIVDVSSAQMDVSRAEDIVDAEDMVLSPGFVDMMGQQSLPYLTNPPSAASKLMQGITLHASGEGFTPAPQSTTTQPDPRLINGEPYSWQTYEDYFNLLDTFGVGVNLVHNVGATQVRLVVIGDEDRPATPEELAEMQALVRQAMEDGASGLSSALIYPPGTYQTTEELIALASEIAPYRGVYTTHLRSESSQLLSSIEEAIEIGRAAGVPVHIYHLKAAGQANWPLMAEAIDLINAARAEGLDVTADIYPYLRSGLGLAAFMPPDASANGWDAMRASLADPALRTIYRERIETETNWENWYHHIGSNWQNVQIISNALGEEYNGLSIVEAADLAGKPVWDFVFDVIETTPLAVAPLVMDEGQKETALSAPWVMFDTDIAPVTTAGTHPRAYGAMPRVLAQYVRERNILTLEDAIRRLTSTGALRLGVHDRGLIASGYAADLVLFDPETIQDEATYSDPAQYPTGIRHVWVNGEYAVRDGIFTGALAGAVIRIGHNSGD